jgi:hypothetical protein
VLFKNTYDILQATICYVLGMHFEEGRGIAFENNMVLCSSNALQLGTIKECKNKVTCNSTIPSIDRSHTCVIICAFYYEAIQQFPTHHFQQPDL